MADSLEDLTPNELLAEARRRGEKSSLLESLLNDPATRGEALKLIKKKNPTTPIPELDTQEAIERATAAERAEREKLEARIREREIKDRMADEWARARDANGLTDEDRAAVEALMTDKEAPIPSYAGAAKVHAASKVQATPTAGAISPPVYEMPGKDTWGKGVGNRALLDKIATAEAYKAMNEITGRVKAA